MAQLLRADGTTQEIKPTKGKMFTLEELQTFVGGYIEAVHLGKKIMMVNEEGKLQHLPPNKQATNIANQCSAIWEGDYIVGNVVIGTLKEMGG